MQDISLVEFERQLMWWMTVTEVIENETEITQSILRWRLRGASLTECQRRLTEAGHKRVTKERIRHIYSNVTRRIWASMVPPANVSKTQDEE